MRSNRIGKTFFRNMIRIFLVGSGLTVLVYFLVSQSEYNQARRDFNRTALDLFESVSRRVKESEAFLNSVRKSLVREKKEHKVYKAYAAELIRLFPYVRQLDLLQVETVKPVTGRTGSSVRSFRTLVYIANPSYRGTLIPLTVSEYHKQIERINVTRDRAIFPAGKGNREYYLLVKQVSADSGARTRQYLVLVIDLKRILSHSVARVGPYESIQIEHRGDLVFHRRPAKHTVQSAMMSRLEYHAQIASGMQPFIISVYRNTNWATINVALLLIVFSACMFLSALVFYSFYIRRRIIRSRDRAREMIFREKKKAEVTFVSIEDAVIITDRNGLVDYLNPAAAKLSGLVLEKALGRKAVSIVSICDQQTMPVLPAALDSCLRQGATFVFPERTVLVDEENEIHVSGSISAIRNRKGEIEGATIVYRDISQARELTEALNWKATHDDLTRLYNRGEFILRMRKALDACQNQGIGSVLIYLDLDQFKIVNDACGHVVGDMLLERVARLLETQVRDYDVIARLGGDEFAILLEDCTMDDAINVARKLNKALKTYHFKWREKVFDIAASLGLVEITPDYKVSEMLSLADSACYLAKEKGRNGYHVYSHDDDAMMQHRGEMEWVQRIKQAYEEGRFVLYMQEIRRLHAGPDKGPRHFEVLLRMLDPEDNVILPMSYVMAAERYDKMNELDQWVLKNAFSLIYAYRVATGDTETSFSINLSGQSLGHTDMVEFVKAELEKYPGLSRQIIFEITETAATSNPAQAQRFVSIFKTMGVRFSLDDFGSGFSSFAYLKNMPVDYLKIDGQFIRDIGKNQVNHALVYSINQIGHVMGLKTIAEYVESEQIKEVLLNIGVDYGQGNWFSRPFAMREYLEQREKESRKKES